jgi:4-oxalocrotonate tautomerase
MPHVIVKLWPGKSEQQKQKLAEGVTQVVMSSLGYGKESVSVSVEEIAPGDWTDKVYRADILNGCLVALQQGTLQGLSQFLLRRPPSP